MYWHLLAFEEALGVAAADSPLDMVTDAGIFQRTGNLNLTLSEPWQLIAAHYNAANATEADIDASMINGVGRHNIWPVNRSASILSPPRIADYRRNPILLPQKEDISIRGSNNLGAATENSTALLWLTPVGWKPRWPSPRPLSVLEPDKVTVRATVTITTVAQAWSGLNEIALTDNLRGGIYAIVGCSVFTAGPLAFRLSFPVQKEVNRRKLRPGGLTIEAIGNQENFDFSRDMGEWGRFDSYELPSMELYSDGAAAESVVMFLDLVRLGEDRSLLYGT